MRSGRNNSYNGYYEIIYRMKTEREMHGGVTSLYKNVNEDSIQKVVIPEFPPVKHVREAKLGNKDRISRYGEKARHLRRVSNIHLKESCIKDFKLDIESLVGYFKTNEYRVAEHLGETGRDKLDSLSVIDILHSLEDEKRDFVLIVPRYHYLSNHSRVLCFNYFIERSHLGIRQDHVIIVDYWGVECHTCMMLLSECDYDYTVIVPGSISHVIHLPQEPCCRLNWALCRIEMLCRNDILGDIAVFAGSKIASDYLSTLIVKRCAYKEGRLPDEDSESYPLVASENCTRLIRPPVDSITFYILNGNRLDKIDTPKINSMKKRNIVFVLNEDGLSLLNERFNIHFVVDTGLHAQYGEYNAEPLQISVSQALARAAIQGFVYRGYTKEMLEACNNKGMRLKDASYQLLSLIFWNVESAFIPGRSVLRLIRLGLIRYVRKCKEKPERSIFEITQRGKAVYDIATLVFDGSIFRSHNALETFCYLVCAVEYSCLGDAFGNISKVYSISSDKNTRFNLILIKSLAKKYGIRCKSQSATWMECLLYTLYYKIAVKEGSRYRILSDSALFYMNFNEPSKYIIILESIGQSVKKYLPVSFSLIASSCQPYYIFSEFLSDSRTCGDDGTVLTDEHRGLCEIFNFNSKTLPVWRSQKKKQDCEGSEEEASGTLNVDNADLGDIFEEDNQYI
ncbi:hypothetical protein PAEPH01_0977 [Pancytospora epiphaga]|nr:hypothetical protein PAEPH01_0977 [Pancytospora epiphaga]